MTLQLQHSKTEGYFRAYLKRRHELSKYLEKVVDFSQGHFYAFLTDEARKDQLYAFESGGILPRNPIEEISIKSIGTYRGEWIHSSLDEFCVWLYETLSESQDSCLIEDLLQEPSDPHVDLYKKIGIAVDAHIFYHLHKGNISEELVTGAIKEAHTPWHFVGAICTNTHLPTACQALSEQEFTSQITDVKTIMIGAYDGEGFIVWEKAVSP